MVVFHHRVLCALYDHDPWGVDTDLSAVLHGAGVSDYLFLRKRRCI